MQSKSRIICHAIVIAFSCLLKIEIGLTYKHVEKYH